MSKSTQTQYIVHPDFADVVADQWFDVSYWQANHAVLGNAQGRGSVQFVRYHSQKLVLRHYLRGGVPARFNRDKYLFSCAEKTRSFREFVLTQKLYDLGLPVPKPVAARFVRHGLWYRADFISVYITNSQTLYAYLQKQPEDQSIWQQVKEVVQQFHKVGLNHVDLNVHNILVTEDKKIYLIDFDRCHLHATAKQKAANFARLARSATKEFGQTVS